MGPDFHRGLDVDGELHIDADLGRVARLIVDHGIVAASGAMVGCQHHTDRNGPAEVAGLELDDLGCRGIERQVDDDGVN